MVSNVELELNLKINNMIVIFAGQERGNTESYESLNKFIEFINGKVYIGSPNEWNGFNVKHEYIQTKPLLYNTIFEESRHDHFMNYKHQWSALYQTYQAIKDTIEANEIIVKLRNDIIIGLDGFELPEMNDGEIWVPEKEFHEDKPFDTSVVCNDQIVMGTKSAMNIYFDLPFKYDWMTPKDSSIETILRMYLLQNDLELKTFKLNYKRG